MAASDILKVTQHASTGSKYDWGTYFPHLAQNLRLTKYDFKPIFDNVLNHKLMRSEIERVAKNEMRDSNLSYEEQDEQYEELLRKYTRRARKLLIEMRCTLSDNLLRLTSYVLYKLLPWFLSGVVAHPAQIDMIKVAQKKMPNTPLVFLPLHRSHLDYILVTFILLNNDIKCPQVAAGDNLNMPVFG
jgi:glycerol-3-phosphate O-acyltransferase 1/2